MKQIRRIVSVPCGDCYGTGKAVGGDCATCKGRGDVDRVVWEIINEDENAHSQQEAQRG